MTESIEIDLSDPGHLVEPPILDFLAHDPDLHAYIVEFVPDPKLSKARKELAVLLDSGSSARRTRELLAELSRVIGTGSPVVRIGHAGGGDFDFYTADDRHLTIHDSPSSAATFEAYNILQVLSLEAQIAFLSQQHRDERAAG